MNFLNPFVLFGLAAAGVPLLLHLLARRRAREIPFPSTRLLSQLQTDRIRMLRLKQLLLLILRTLIMICIVTGFARPALRSAFHAGARTSAVIIIDNSASMTTIEDGEALFGRAKRLASDVIGLLREGDTAAIVVTAGEPYLLDPGMTSDLKVLNECIGDMELSHTEGDPNSAFSAAMDVLSIPRTVNKEIYFLTDGARNALPDSVVTNDGTGNIRLYTVSIGAEQRRGSVMESFRLADKIVVPGSPLTFVAEGRTGTDDGEVDVSFFVNGERKRKVTVTPGADGIFTADFVYTPEKTGWIEVAASTGYGEFEDGETRRLAVHAQEPVTVLIISDGYSDGYFLHQMLSTARADSAFVTTVVESADVTPAAVAEAAVIVLSGVRELVEETYRAIVSGVMQGGKGLIVIPPDNALTVLYEDGIFRDMFPLGEYRTVVLENRDGLRYTVMDRYDYTHPIMRGISQSGVFTYPVVTSYLAAAPFPGARVFAHYSDGTMAAADMDCGNGHVILYTGDAATLTGELAFTGIFIPMFLRSVQYLSDTLPETEGSETGKPVVVTFTDDEMPNQVTMKHDDNSAVRVAFDHSGTHTTLRNYTGEEPGFYTVAADGVEKYHIGIDIPHDEAVFSRAGNEAFAEAFGNLSWRMFDEKEDIAEAVNRDRYGTELAGLFLGVALVLLAAEMVLARKA